MAVSTADLKRVGQLVESWLDQRHAPSPSLSDLKAAITRGADIWDRGNMDGHLTASAIVVSPDHSLVLLVHNRALNRFLAPGGHVDPGEMPAEAAQRELREETGLCAAPSGELPLDIDIHDIPARPSRGEGHHRHFDFRYLMTGNPKQKCQIDGHEIISAHWKPIYDIKQAYPRVYEALIRL